MVNFLLSPIKDPVEDNKAKPPSPDIILRRDNDFMRAAAPHQWDSNEEDEDLETLNEEFGVFEKLGCTHTHISRFTENGLRK